MGADSAEPEGHVQPEEPKKGRGPLFFVVVIFAVLCVLGVCGMGVLATLMMPALLKAKLRANETRCSNNLKQIAIAAIMYADENRYFPTDPTDPTGRKALESLFPKYLDNAEALTCPCDDDGAFSYDGFPVLRTTNARSDTPIAWDRKAHPDGTRNVVMVDGHTTRVDEATFQEVLTRARANPATRR